MKTLLINPPMQVNMEPEVPPFGIAYVAAALRKAGHQADILDIDSHRLTKEEAARRIKNSDADIVGIGGLASVYPYLDWLVPQIRMLKPGVKIFLGGALASSLKERCLERFDIDYIVVGEGEITAVELLGKIPAGDSLAAVKGLAFREGGKVVFTGYRPLMPSLEEVPIFDPAPFPMERLLKNTRGTIQVHVQRGCPSNCTFCFNCYRVVSGKVRYRPADKVIDEIEYLKNLYGEKIRLFALSGECVTMNKEWLIGFCKGILDRGLRINYRVTSRVDTIDEERLAWLKKSGCVSMSLGLESGSPKILKIMKKGSTVEQNKKAAALAKRYIRNIEACVILGYVGENEETLEETVRFCKAIDVRPVIFFATPFPGTELYAMAVERGRIKDEERYLMGLDRTLTFNLSLNLTDMPDEMAFRLLRGAVRGIERHYLIREMISLKICKRIMEKLTEKGLKNTVGWAGRRFREIFAVNR